MDDKWVVAIIAFLVGIFLGKTLEKKNMGGYGETGLGASGTPRFGRPKTDEERLETHRRLYGNENLPPRGTGLRKRGGIV